MASIRRFARKRLMEHCNSLQEEHTAEDVYRAFQQEATLLYHTELAKTSLASDPFEAFSDIRKVIDRLRSLIQVTDYDCVRLHTGYVRIHTTIQIKADKSTSGIQQHLQLDFRYEREGEPTPKPMVSYAIDLSHDNGPKTNLLWVQVLASQQTPSRQHKAKYIGGGDDDDEDGWEDIDDDDEEGGDEQKPKRAKREGAAVVIEVDDENEQQSSAGHEANDEQQEDDDSDCDKFDAGIDPDVLGTFLDMTGLGRIQDDKAFFLLMTFPFYEHEWDLVGFVLDAVFGAQSDSDDEA